MNKKAIKSTIESTILEIEKEYQKTQGLILTEDDLKAIIYRKLAKDSKLSKPQPTKDKHISASPLHTELSWYDKRGRLTIRPDITILDPKYLSILHRKGDKVSLPSKGYSFGGHAVLMELKFIKNKTGIRKTTIDGPLKKDIQKMERLFKRLEDQKAPYYLFCYFIIFNKTGILCNEFEEFLRLANSAKPSRYKVVYATGKVEFPK